MNTLLELRQISKTYGLVRALHQLSFNIPQGSVFGILGPNGSGKTTLLGIILDVIRADAGTYQWTGYKDSQQARRSMGSLLETPNFYPYLSAVENLRINALIKNCPVRNIDEVLKRVGLFERRDSKFQTYSLGMKQRLAIAAALLSNPRVLILDEPTNGLDPAGIAEIRHLIRELHHTGTTIIMASHLLYEVELLCSDVAILRRGELLGSGPVEEILQEDDWLELGSDNQEALWQLLQQYPQKLHIRKDSFLLVRMEPNIQASQINQWCSSHHIFLHHLRIRKRSLESKFMELTQEPQTQLPQ